MGWSEEAMIRSEQQEEELMGEWHREHPEEATEISRLPPSEQNRAERAAMGPAVDYARQKAALEERMGLEGSHLSPQRLRLLDEYNRDEERHD